MAGGPVEKSTRLQQWRGETRKILRDKLNVEKAIDELEFVTEKVHAHLNDLTANQVGALKLLADNAWRKLAKVLPDVKSVEHELGENAEKLTRDLLNERLAVLHAGTHRRLNGLGSSGDVGTPDGATTAH